MSEDTNMDPNAGVTPAEDSNEQTMPATDAPAEVATEGETPATGAAPTEETKPEETPAM